MAHQILSKIIQLNIAMQYYTFVENGANYTLFSILIKFVSGYKLAAYVFLPLVLSKYHFSDYIGNTEGLYDYIRNTDGGIF